MSIKTNLLEQNVNFVETTKERKNYFKIVVIVYGYFMFVSFVLISRQYKPNLMADFMRMKYENPKMKHSEITNQLSYSTRTLQRYRNHINMLSPYRIHPNTTIKRSKNVSNTKLDNNSHREHDLKKPQLTSNDLTSNEPVKNEKNKLKCGANIELNGICLDKIEHNNYL